MIVTKRPVLPVGFIVGSHPLYQDGDVYAVLDGWHWPGPDHDWHDLIDEHLMILTVRDSEPWVEAWRMRTGEFRVIQRII